MWFNITYLMCLHQDHISTWFRLLRRSTFSDRSSCRSQNGDAATALCPKNRKIIILFSLRSCFYMQVTVKKMPPNIWFISLFFKAIFDLLRGRWRLIRMLGHFRCCGDRCNCGFRIWTLRITCKWNMVYIFNFYLCVNIFN